MSQITSYQPCESLDCAKISVSSSVVPPSTSSSSVSQVLLGPVPTIEEFRVRRLLFGFKFRAMRKQLSKESCHPQTQTTVTSTVMSSSGGSRSSDEEEARNTGGRVVRAPIHFTKKDPGADKVITATATTTAAEDGRPPSPELQGSAEKAESAPSPPRKVFRNLFRLKGPKQNQVVAGLNQDPCEKFSECQAAPPSYQEARIEAAWREIGIDVDDPKHGPRPHCTPEQLMQSMDAFFGKVSCHASGDCNSSKDVNKEKKKEKKEKNKVGGRDPLGPTKVPEQQKIKRTLSEDSGFAEKRGQTESLCLTGNLKDSGWA